jgi:hypothetical protein
MKVSLVYLIDDYIRTRFKCVYIKLLHVNGMYVVDNLHGLIFTTSSGFSMNVCPENVIA